MNITVRLLTKFALVFLVLVRFNGYYCNVALFSTDFIDLEVKATLRILFCGSSVPFQLAITA